MVNAKPPQLYQHVVQKHAGSLPTECFPVELKDFDPNDPDGKNKASSTGTGAVVKPKKTVKKDNNLDDLLSAGLAATKKKGKK